MCSCARVELEANGGDHAAQSSYMQSTTSCCCMRACPAADRSRSLQVPRLRADAVSRVTRSLADCYELVFSVVEDPRSGYLEQGGAAAIKHTPAQVRTILGAI